MWTQRRQDGLQAVGRVGVVDIGLSAVLPAAHALQPARGPLDALQRAEDRLGALSGGDAEPGRHQGVGGLEGAGQGQLHLMHTVRHAQLQALAVGQELALEQGDRLSPLTDREHGLAGHHRRAGKGGEGV